MHYVIVSIWVLYHNVIIYYASSYGTTETSGVTRNVSFIVIVLIHSCIVRNHEVYLSLINRGLIYLYLANHPSQSSA
jgi:hypothetical protein